MKEKIIEIIKKTPFYKIYRKNFYETKLQNYNRDFLQKDECSLYIKELLLKDEPFMISRFGSNELSYIKSYLKKQEYTKEQINRAINNTGIFPNDKKTIDLVVNEYLNSTQNIDLLGVWFNPFEDKVVNEYCINTKITELRSLEPYFSTEPWSYYLKKKKVLVVHPFNQSIEKQYLKRKLLFIDSKILPEFELMTYPAIQSIGGNDNFSSWFDALEKMKKDILEIDFEIAIIGAGAYGLPLASYIKSLGKKAIHLGGSTQMLFGVYGQRWAIHPDFKDIINDNWIKPNQNEKPQSAKKVENACYW